MEESGIQSAYPMQTVAESLRFKVLELRELL